MKLAEVRSAVLGVIAAALVPFAALGADSLAIPFDSTGRGSMGAESLVVESSVAETLAAVQTEAPVFLGGRRIFTIRAPRKGLQPEARASAIRARLDLVVRDLATPADSVWMLRVRDGVEVHLGRHFLWMITPGDVAGASVQDLAKLVSELPVQITTGVLRERASRRPLGVLISVLIGLGATLLAWLLMSLLRAAGRRWRAFLARELPKHVGGIRIGNYDFLSREQLTGVTVGVLGQIGLIADVLVLYGWLTVVFSLFPWSQGWSWNLMQFARQELLGAMMSMGRAVPSILILVGIGFGFYWLTKVSDRFFDAVGAGTVQVDWIHPDVASPTKRLVKIALWMCAIAVAYPYIPGTQSKAVQGVSILLGVMVSLGSSGIVGNMIAGLVLLYSRSFKIGERVKLGEHIGDIVSLGFFATKLRTPRNEELTIPNGHIAGQPILNYTRLALERGLILHTQVTIGYNAEWRKVHELLIEAAGRVEGVEREPAPWVFQRALNDFHITYEICCVTKRSLDQLQLYSRLHGEIQDAFARAGIEILSPTYTSLRDANVAILPQEPNGPRAAPGGFRIQPSQEGG